MTAATTGGESEYASRSTVNVAIVAGTSARRSGAIRSIAWHFTHTRCGGRCRAPHAWQRLPVKANFHASARGGRRLGGLRVGPPRRLAFQEPPPREEGR